MSDAFAFLTARWINLAMLTYRLDPKILQPFVPPGCVLDTKDDAAFASLVAFDFTTTRVLGVPWPGFSDFPEINLRFYVRHGDDRGVCFIREFVPKQTVARLARWIYNEPYKTAAMTSHVKTTNDSISVCHKLEVGGRKNIVQMTADRQTICPVPLSSESFFKDQQWGFGTSRSGKLIRYRVVHPLWKIHPVQSFSLDWDWGSVYGPYFAMLQEMQPMSVMLVEGSAVKLYPFARLKPAPARPIEVTHGLESTAKS
jgi:uncharacterized protein YqjF (DUF2071 family)